jgi:NADH dehydrogenase
VLALGDMAAVQRADGAAEPLPGVAPVAMQQGRHAASTIRRRLAGRAARPFRYRDKGDVATIGRMRAVLRVGRLELGGVVAWLAYLAVHLLYLVGLQNRLLVLIRWVAGFVTRRRGARLITPAPRPSMGR